MSGNHWQTPDNVLERVRAIGSIALDPCTVPANPVGAPAIITKDDVPCGLEADWPSRSKGGLIYVNPPYGRGYTLPWALKIVEESRRGCEIVALVRGDTSTRAARELIRAAQVICFPPRIRFKGADGAPPFSNLVLYFGARPTVFRRAFDGFGIVVAPIPTNQSIKRK